MNKKQSWNIITLFLLMIFGLTAATMLKPDTDFSEKENRALASMPEFSWGSLFSGEFTADYETYLTDQFVFRDGWIGLKTMVERLSFRQETKDIYFAKDDYLLEKHTETFETPQAESNIAYLTAFFEKMSEKYDSDHLSVMVVPTAVEILDEKLPIFASPYDQEQYLNKIAAGLPDGVWFDTRELLEQHQNEEIYYRTDHHWETLAAFYTFEQWAKEKNLGQINAQDYEITTIADDFEGTIASKVGTKVVPDTIEIYQHKEQVPYHLTYNQTDDYRSTVYQEHVLDSKDKYSYFYGGNYGLVEADMEQKTGRKLLVIKDSYAHCFVPFTYQLFDEVDMLDLRYFNQKLSEFIEAGEYTDILFLQNISGFAGDTSLVKLTM